MAHKQSALAASIADALRYANNQLPTIRRGTLKLRECGPVQIVAELDTDVETNTERVRFAARMRAKLPGQHRSTIIEGRLNDSPRNAITALVVEIDRWLELVARERTMGEALKARGLK